MTLDPARLAWFELSAVIAPLPGRVVRTWSPHRFSVAQRGTVRHGQRVRHNADSQANARVSLGVCLIIWAVGVAFDTCRYSPAKLASHDWTGHLKEGVGRGNEGG